jgi:hypothetical protein
LSCGPSLVGRYARIENLFRPAAGSARFHRCRPQSDGDRRPATQDCRVEGSRCTILLTRPRVVLNGHCSEPLRCLSCRAAPEPWGRGPDQPPTKAHQFRARCTASGSTPIQPIGLLPLARSTHVQKRAASCIIAVSMSRPAPSVVSTSGPDGDRRRSGRRPHQALQTRYYFPQGKTAAGPGGGLKEFVRWSALHRCASAPPCTTPMR